MLTLLSDALANDGFAREWRAGIVQVARYFPDRYPDATPGFDWLVGFINERKDRYTQVSAARAIRDEYRLSIGKRRETVAELAEKATDPEVKKLLMEALVKGE